MLGLVKALKMATVAAEKRLSKPGEKKAKGDQAKTARAIRLLRRGAISRAGKALESKGIGELDNDEIWDQMKKNTRRGRSRLGKNITCSNPKRRSS